MQDTAIWCYQDYILFTYCFFGACVLIKNDIIGEIRASISFHDESFSK